MKLDSLLSRYLRFALSFPIDARQLSQEDHATITDQVFELSKKIHVKDQRNRTLNDIINSVYYGKLVEYCVFRRLCAAELNAVQNIEEYTDDYCWDIVINEDTQFEKLEIKLITDSTDRKLISWNDKNKIANAMMYWEKFDYMIVTVMHDLVIYPWYLLDNQVWNPINDLFMDSKFNERGVFIKSSAESQGFMKKLCERPQ